MVFLRRTNTSTEKTPGKAKRAWLSFKGAQWPAGDMAGWLCRAGPGSLQITMTDVGDVLICVSLVGRGGDRDKVELC